MVGLMCTVAAALRVTQPVLLQLLIGYFQVSTSDSKYIQMKSKAKQKMEEIYYLAQKFVTLLRLS